MMMNDLVEDLADDLGLPLTLEDELQEQIDDAIFDVVDDWRRQYEGACVWPRQCSCDLRQRVHAALVCDYHGRCSCTAVPAAWGGAGCQMHPTVFGAEPWVVAQVISHVTEDGRQVPSFPYDVAQARRDHEKAARA